MKNASCLQTKRRWRYSLMLILLASWALAHGQVVLDLATTYSGRNIHAESVREFATRVAEATDDAVSIIVHEGGALGLRDEDHFPAVADGIVPLANVLMGAAAGADPLFGLSTLPFLVRDFAEARLLHDIARPFYEAAAERFDQKLLFTAPWPPSGIHARRPVLAYEDIRGLRVRTFDRNGTDVLNRAGANAVVMSWGDVYPALATGTIDSVLTSAQSAVDASFWEVLEHYTRVNFAIPLNMITINLDTWNSLSSDQQEAIMAVASELEQERWQLAEAVMVADEERLAAEGMTVVTEVDADFAAALNADGAAIAQTWLSTVGTVGADILEQFEAQR